MEEDPRHDKPADCSLPVNVDKRDIDQQQLNRKKPYKKPALKKYAQIRMTGYGGPD
jgi:hypothetical protein